MSPQKNMDMNMAENACFLSLLMDLRSYNTCNQGNKYMEICNAEHYCASIYAINSIKEQEGKKLYQFKSQISRLFQGFLRLFTWLVLVRN